MTTEGLSAAGRATRDATGDPTDDGARDAWRGEPAGTPRLAWQRVGRRVWRLARTEVRLYRRLGVLAAAAVLTGLWVVVLVALPAPTARAVAPFVLLTDIAALAFLVVPALLVVERGQGVERATRVTPAHPGEVVGVRVGVAASTAVAGAIPIVVAGGLPEPGLAVLGVASISVLLGLVACALVAGAGSLTVLVARSPFVAGPLLGLALVEATGLSDSRLLQASPVTSALALTRGELSWPGLAWQVAAVAAAAVVAVRLLDRPPADGQATAASAAPGAVRRVVEARALVAAHPGSYRTVAAVRALLRSDRRTLLRDSLLVMLLVGVLVVAVAARLVGTVGVPWAGSRYGVDLAEQLPVVWAFLLVVHTPVMIGSLVGLLLLEDRDGGVLPALATTRASLATLLGYRLGATMLVTAALVAISLPLAGASHPAGATGMVATVTAAAVVSPVPAMLLAALARDRVQGIAVMKATGLPLYLPLATWFLDPGLRWLLAPIPTAWTAWVSWAETPAGALGYLAGAVALSALVTAGLARRFLATATSGT